VPHAEDSHFFSVERGMWAAELLQPEHGTRFDPPALSQ
jgi:hypothetical protein